MSVDWRDEAACRGVDTVEVFYPGPGHPETQYAEARRLCNSCPVIAQCLAACIEEEAAFRRDDICGFRGGLTAKARMVLRTQRLVKPCGTSAAYERHIYNGESPCGPCKEANRRYKAQRRLKEAS